MESSSREKEHGGLKTEREGAREGRREVTVKSAESVRVCVWGGGCPCSFTRTRHIYVKMYVHM